MNFVAGDSLLRLEEPEKAVPYLQAALAADPKLAGRGRVARAGAFATGKECGGRSAPGAGAGAGRRRQPALPVGERLPRQRQRREGARRNGEISGDREAQRGAEGGGGERGADRAAEVAELRGRRWLADSVRVCACAAAHRAPRRSAFARSREDAGISFVLENSPTDRKHLIETMPGGIAVLDYDGDGRPDIYFTNGAEIPSLEKSSPKYWNRLYRNEGGMKFRDVTEAGRASRARATRWAPPRPTTTTTATPTSSSPASIATSLYHNLGNGRFEDVTAKAGIASGEWAVAAGMVRLRPRRQTRPLGGALRQMVARATTAIAATPSQGPAHLLPSEILRGARQHALPQSRRRHVRGRHRARRASRSIAGRGMSVAFADYDQDGWPDVFVTNDNMPNFLFHNTGNGTFEEVALLGRRGAARSRQAGREHGGGVQGLRQRRPAGHLRHCARRRDVSRCFATSARAISRTRLISRSVGALSVKHSGWGLGLFDFNNDGWKDLFTANSHVNDRVELTERGRLSREELGLRERRRDLSGRFRGRRV